MIHEREIREKLAKVQSSEMSVNDFRSWLNARSLNMHLENNSPSARRLAAVVGLALAEHLIGDRTDEELLAALRRIAATVEASVDMLPPGVEQVQLKTTQTSTSLVSRRDLLVLA
jgi:hypothetical protein